MRVRAVLLVLCLLASRLRAQEPASPELRLGTHAIRRITFDVLRDNPSKKCEILTGWHQVTDPSKTVLVLLGDLRNVMWRIPGGADGFLRAGGAILLASDSRVNDRDLKQATGGYRISGGKVAGWAADDPRRARVVAISPSAVYRGLDEEALEAGFNQGLRGCLVATVLPTKHISLFVGQNLFEGKGITLRVVTNRPSYIERDPFYSRNRNVTRIANLPTWAYYEDKRFTPPIPYPLALASEGRGRMVMLADHSIFINEMMLQTDNPNIPEDDIGNVAFAYNVMEWLKGEEKERNRVLFVVDGSIETELDVVLRTIKISLAQLQQMAAQKGNELLLDKVNNQMGDLNGKVVRGLGNGPGRALFRSRSSLRNFSLLILGGVSLLFVFLLLRRLGQASHGVERGLPLLVSALDKRAPRREAIVHRQELLLREDNLLAEARGLAREELRAHGIPPSDQPPRFRAEGNWWHRRKLVRLARWIWQVAYGTSPPQLTRKKFRRFLQQIEHLRKALEQQQLTFVGWAEEHSDEGPP